MNNFEVKNVLELKKKEIQVHVDLLKIIELARRLPLKFVSLKLSVQVTGCCATLSITIQFNKKK